MKKLTLFVAVTFVGMLCWAFTADHFVKNFQKELLEYEWKIEKMQYKPTYEIMSFENAYKVKFTKNSLTFGLEKNNYHTRILLKRNIFRAGEWTSSSVCCDTRQGVTFAQAITSKLSKSFHVKRDELVIKDAKYTFWLKKVRK